MLLSPEIEVIAGALVVLWSGGIIDVPRGGETARECGLRHRQRPESQTKVVGNSYSPQRLVLMARHGDLAGVLEHGIGAKGYPGTWEISSLPAEGFFFSRYCRTKGKLRRSRMSDEKS